MRKHTVLFLTGRSDRHQKAALAAAPQGLDVIMRRDASRSQVMALLPDADFLISERIGAIDRDMIATGKKLKLIQRLGSQGWDIDTKAAQDAGIPVCLMPVRTCLMVAEHSVLLMLALARRMRELLDITDRAGDWGLSPRRCDENYFAYNWSKRTRIDSLYHATIGILGFGEIGTELAKQLSGFRCRILYSKRQRLPASIENELRLSYVPRDELARQSDFVVCLLPNLPENNQSIGRDFFLQMKRGAYLVHCGAPGVVIEDDLIVALRDKQLGGAAIDCFTYEPLRPDDPLVAVARDLENNLVLTPHVAAGTTSASANERLDDYANIVAVLNGQELRHRLV